MHSCSITMSKIYMFFECGNQPILHLLIATRVDSIFPSKLMFLQWKQKRYSPTFTQHAYPTLYFVNAERVGHNSAYLTCVTAHVLVYKPAHYRLCKLYASTQSVEPAASRLLILIKQPTSLYDTKQIVINALISLSNSVDVTIRFMVAQTITFHLYHTKQSLLFHERRL